MRLDVSPTTPTNKLTLLLRLLTTKSADASVTHLFCVQLVLGGGVSKKCPKPPPNHTSSVRVHRAMEVVTELKTVFFIVSPKPVYIGCLQRLVLGDFQLLY